MTNAELSAGVANNPVSARKRRANRRAAIVIALVAAGFYVAFVLNMFFVG